MNSNNSLMTARQLLLRAQSETRSELLAGRLVERPFAPWICGAIAARLAFALNESVRDDKGVLVNSGTGFQLGRAPDTVLAPSIAFIAKDRLPADLSALVGFFPGAPDLAVEVVSPGDTYAEVEDKTMRYLDDGTRLVWIVRPQQKRVEVDRADGTSALLSNGDALDGETVVPGFSLLVADVFGGRLAATSVRRPAFR